MAANLGVCIFFLGLVSAFQAEALLGYESNPKLEPLEMYEYPPSVSLAAFSLVDVFCSVESIIRSDMLFALSIIHSLNLLLYDLSLDSSSNSQPLLVPTSFKSKERSPIL